MSNAPRDPVLTTRLTIGYQQGSDVLRDVQLNIARGEILGLAGQSGAGKSTLALAILGLLHHKAAGLRGSIRLYGRELIGLPEREMRQIRGRDVALVLQSPLSSLNPALRIGTQLAEAWRAHGRGSRHDCAACLRQAMFEVQLPTEPEFLRRYPSQISIGQAQRVLIAMAILHRPSLLIADEPTSALDIITQAEILQLFARLNRELGMAILYISHDLLSSGQLCQRIAILHQGEIVECAPTAEIFAAPKHPYTQRLMQALPQPDLPGWRLAAAGD